MNKLFSLGNTSSCRFLSSNFVISKSIGIVNTIDRKIVTCKRCETLRHGIAGSEGKSNLSFIRAFHSKNGKSHHQRFLRGEMRALGGILRRSGFDSNEDVARLLGLGSCGFSTSNRCRNQGNRDEEEDNNKKNNEKGNIPILPRVLMWFWLLFTLNVVWQLVQDSRNLVREISWNEFYYDMLTKGEVEAIVVKPDYEAVLVQLYDGAVIKGKKTDFRQFIMKVPDPYKFEEKIRKFEEEMGIKPENSINISYQMISSRTQMVFLAVTALAIFLLFRSYFSKIQFPNPTELFANERKAKFVRVDVLSQQGKGINFKDVAGLKEAKQEVIEFVDYLKTPDRFKELGAKIPRGALLLGPPGCGKTLLARAVASEARVPFLAMAGSEFVEMLGGLGAARVRDLFKEAKKRTPCIVYIDEIDAVGRKRGGSSLGSNAEEEQTLNQLLVEMDGMGTQEGVIVLASTNRADVLDKALLRPGRFDRHITIDLPTMIERRELFEMYLKKLKLSTPAESIAERLAQMTPGMSGADIANVCNEAAIHAVRDCKKVVEPSDFDYALERVIAGVEKRTGLLGPEEKKIVAYHESGHALVGWLLKYTDALLRISIVPRTNSALGFAQYKPSDQKLYNTEELFDRMCMALGGRAAEAVIFNHVTTGAQDDLRKVTEMAYDQIQSYGMNESIGPLSFPRQSSGQLGTKPYSKKLAAIMDEEAQVLIARAFKHTEELLRKNTDKLHLMASNLLEKEVLSYDDIEKLIGPPPYGEKKKLEPHGWEGIMPSNDNNNNRTSKT